MSKNSIKQSVFFILSISLFFGAGYLYRASRISFPAIEKAPENNKEPIVSPFSRIDPPENLSPYQVSEDHYGIVAIGTAGRYDCTEEECLYRDTDGGMEGFTTITGYYKNIYIPEEKGADREYDATNCEGFVLMTGNSDVLEFIGRVDDFGELKNNPIKIKVPRNMENTIKFSTPENPISLNIIIKSSPQHGVNPCWSPIGIISIKN